MLTASFWLLRLPSSLSLLPLRAGVAAVDSAVVIPVVVVVIVTVALLFKKVISGIVYLLGNNFTIIHVVTSALSSCETASIYVINCYHQHIS